VVVVAEHLVGRVEQLGVVDQALDVLAKGQPSALAVVGEPGIGKTRLLAELADRADRRGCLVLSGSAAELERDLPFWVFVDAIEEYLRGLEPRRVVVLDEDVRVELAAIFPSLPGFAAAGAPALVHERYRGHRAVCELLERLTAISPLVLVLDDVHWADDASVELLGALLRRPPAAAVLIAVALRPRQAPSRLSAVLERAYLTRLVTRVDVSAFSVEQAREFLGARVDAATAAALYGETGGNPFYLQQLARVTELERSADRVEGTLAAVEVPAAVAAALDCCRTGPDGSCRVRRCPVIRSSPTRLPPGRPPRRRPPWGRSTNCCGSI
jgi:predicted ATPase